MTSPAWRPIHPTRETAMVGGRVVALSAVWTNGTYQVALVDVREPERGWAVWRRSRTGAWRRCALALHLTAEEAREVAELDQLRRRTLEGLPLRLLVAGLRLGRPAIGRLPLAALGHALDGLLPLDRARRVALITRYLHAMTCEVPRE